MREDLVLVLNLQDRVLRENVTSVDCTLLTLPLFLTLPSKHLLQISDLLICACDFFLKMKEMSSAIFGRDRDPVLALGETHMRDLGWCVTSKQ